MLTTYSRPKYALNMELSSSPAWSRLLSLPLRQPLDQFQHLAALPLEKGEGKDDQRAESDHGHVPQPTPVQIDRSRLDYRQQRHHQKGRPQEEECANSQHQ